MKRSTKLSTKRKESPIMLLKDKFAKDEYRVNLDVSIDFPIDMTGSDAISMPGYIILSKLFNNNISNPIYFNIALKCNYEHNLNTDIVLMYINKTNLVEKLSIDLKLENTEMVKSFEYLLTTVKPIVTSLTENELNILIPIFGNNDYLDKTKVLYMEKWI